MPYIELVRIDRSDGTEGLARFGPVPCTSRQVTGEVPQPQNVFAITEVVSIDEAPEDRTATADIPTIRERGGPDDRCLRAAVQRRRRVTDEFVSGLRNLIDASAEAPKAVGDDVILIIATRQSPICLKLRQRPGEIILLVQGNAIGLTDHGDAWCLALRPGEDLRRYIGPLLVDRR